MTIAKNISNMFNNDGSACYFEGKDLFQECKNLASEVDQNWEREATRFTFEDNSVITVVNGCWDLGYLNCFCWQGNGHDDMCEEKL